MSLGDAALQIVVLLYEVAAIAAAVNVACVAVLVVVSRCC